MAARDELVGAVVRRYSSGTRAERGLILDEFTSVTRVHRKHAMRLLRSGSPLRRGDPRPNRRVYGVGRHRGTSRRRHLAPSHLGSRFTQIG